MDDIQDFDSVVTDFPGGAPDFAAPSPPEFWDRSTWDPDSLGAAAFGQSTAPYRPPSQVMADATDALLTGPSHPGWSEPVTRMAIDQLTAGAPVGPQPDGLLAGGMRQLAADGDPDLPDWAASDAAMGAGAAEPSATPSATPMRLSERGADFIKSYEAGPDPSGPSLKPYDSLEGGPQTIGWGHKIKPGESFSGGLSADQADALFHKDLQPFEAKVRSAVVGAIDQNQFDALVSLAYNYPGAFKNKDFQSALHSGDFDAVGDQMLGFDHITRTDPDTGQAAKIALPGLTKRRAAERDILVNGHYFNNH